MPPVHVLTVAPGLPLPLLDHVLFHVEQALRECGASHVWISDELPALAVMAELPPDAGVGRP